MAAREVVLGTFTFAFCIACIFAGIDSDVPFAWHEGQPLTIKCSGANKSQLPRLEWVFTDVNNVSRVIGERGNPRIKRISANLVELRLRNFTANHTGHYACRDRSENGKSHTEMSLHIVVTDLLKTCSPQLFQCGNRCIANRFRCDRVEDCIGGLDELGCRTECDPETEFQCVNGQCIDAMYVCDRFHQQNCRDGSDESHCPDRHYVYTGQIQAAGTGEPPQVLAYESRNWQVHGIYSVVAGVIGLVCVVTIIVITICRIHMRRDAQMSMAAMRCTRTRTVSTRSTRSEDSINPRLAAVAVYIQASPQPPPPLLPSELAGLVVSPPPYSEQTDAPPPPYEETAPPQYPDGIPKSSSWEGDGMGNSSAAEEQALQSMALLASSSSHGNSEGAGSGQACITEEELTSASQDTAPSGDVHHA